MPPAITDPRVLEAITRARNRRIAICFVEWSGAGAQKVVIDWTLIDGAEAARILRCSWSRRRAPSPTAPRSAAAIDFSMAQLERAPFESKRRTIDVSGDGTHNSGRGLLTAREDALAKGVTINGLVILSERPLPWNPGAHQSARRACRNIIRTMSSAAPARSSSVAENFKSFGQALISKLIAEIAETPARRDACRPRRAPTETIRASSTFAAADRRRVAIRVSAQRQAWQFRSIPD